MAKKMLLLSSMFLCVNLSAMSGELIDVELKVSASRSTLKEILDLLPESFKNNQDEMKGFIKSLRELSAFSVSPKGSLLIRLLRYQMINDGTDESILSEYEKMKDSVFIGNENDYEHYVDVIKPYRLFVDKEKRLKFIKTLMEYFTIN